VVKRHIREVKSMLNSKMGTEREEVQLKRRDIGRVEIINQVEECFVIAKLDRMILALD
jgi:DNA mismatch repair ATPase MutL